jgi:hypothetical protein
MPEIKHQITTGNLLQIGAMLAAVIVAFVAVQSQTSANAADLIDHEERIRSLEKDVLPVLARIDERLSRIDQRLSTIESAPRRAE